MVYNSQPITVSRLDPTLLFVDIARLFHYFVRVLSTPLVQFFTKDLSYSSKCKGHQCDKHKTIALFNIHFLLSLLRWRKSDIHWSVKQCIASDDLQSVRAGVMHARNFRPASTVSSRIGHFSAGVPKGDDHHEEASTCKRAPLPWRHFPAPEPSHCDSVHAPRIPLPASSQVLLRPRLPKFSFCIPL